jgi:single-strand DNA-binding protein
MSFKSLNKVMLIGNLTRDPEVRNTPSGTAVCTFSIATDRSWKDKSGEIQQAVEYHNLVAWDKLAEICNSLLKKGMLVYVEGWLNTRSWDDDSGKKNYRTEIRVLEMKILNDRGKGEYSKSEDTVKADVAVTGKTPEELLAEMDGEDTDNQSAGEIDDLPF